MRMVDADELIERMRKEAGCENCVDWMGIRCRACDWQAAMDTVDRMANEIKESK